MSVVAYHYPCPDGAFGALAATLGLRGHEASSIRYLPMTVYSKEEERVAAAMTLTADETLYIVDYTGGWAFVSAACSRARRVIILDHHKTAAEELASKAEEIEAMPNLELHIDMNRSGATIARDYFELTPSASEEAGSPTTTSTINADDELRQLFAYIEDNDLWRHALPDTKAFSAGIKDLNFEYDVNKNPSIFDTLAALKVDDVIARGKVALIEIDKIIEAESTQSFIINVVADAAATNTASNSDGAEPEQLLLRCFGVVTLHPNNRSKLGNVLAMKSKAAGLDAAAAVIYVEPGMGDQAESHYKVSFRSIDAVDVSAVAQAFGGGGHAKAASCCVERGVVDSWRSRAGDDDDGSSSSVVGVSVAIGGRDGGGGRSSVIPEGGGDIVVRGLEAADVPAATSVWADAMRSYGKDYIDQFVEQKLMLDMEDAHAEYVASDNKNNFWIAVERDTGAIVGCVGVIFRPAEHMMLAEPPGKGYLSKLKDADGKSLNSGSGGEPLWPMAADGSTACELVRMAVRSDCRGKGVARLLAKTVAGYAEGLGCGWVVLSTSKEMTAAVRTYNSLKFKARQLSTVMAFAARPAELL